MASGGRSSGRIAGSGVDILIYNTVHSGEDYGTITAYIGGSARR
jgi:hypothetical protein